MELPFTSAPGRHERQLRRRHGNPLFAWPPAAVTLEELRAAQHADREELRAFYAALQETVRETGTLPEAVAATRLLELKERLEQHYEQACGLPGDRDRDKAVIERLLEVIMKALRRGADPLTLQELNDDATARAAHFRLLDHPLVADLLHPQTPITAAELVPTLLSASLPEVEAACALFDQAQLLLLAREAEILLTRLRRQGYSDDHAQRCLALLRARLEQYEPDWWVETI